MRIARIPLSLSVAAVAIAAVTLSCGTDRAASPGGSESGNAAVPTRTAVIDSTSGHGTSTEEPLVLAPTATPTPILSGPGDESLAEGHRILAAAKFAFLEADSYRAEVTFVSVRDDETLTRTSSVELGPGRRATGHETNGSAEHELLHVEGISYARPLGQPEHPWFTLGEKPLDALFTLNEAIRAFSNPEIDSRTGTGAEEIIELEGEVKIFVSGALHTDGYERRRETSASMTVNALTMLPVTVQNTFREETVDPATGEVVAVRGWSRHAEVRDYGEVVIDVDHPTNLVPTPSPMFPAPPTPTSLATTPARVDG